LKRKVQSKNVLKGVVFFIYNIDKEMKKIYNRRQTKTIKGQKSGKEKDKGSKKNDISDLKFIKKIILRDKLL